MNTTHVFFARLSAMFFVLLFCSTAFGGGFKVSICHYPSDNPDNFYTIRVNENAVPAHLNHLGDFQGACEDLPPVEPPTEPPQASCPCFTTETLENLGSLVSCMDLPDANTYYLDFSNELNNDLSYACVGECLAEVTPQCGIDNAVDPSLSFYQYPIDTDSEAACHSLLETYCSNANP